jgi:hypothetical protein
MTDHEKTALMKLERLLANRGLVFAPAVKFEIAQRAISFQNLDGLLEPCLDVRVEQALDHFLALRRDRARKAG